MADRILFGFWRAVVGVPRALWRSEIAKNAVKTRARVESLVSDEHRFWSEEHARKYRRQMSDTRGLYVTLEQSVLITRATQSALSGCPPLQSPP